MNEDVEIRVTENTVKDYEVDLILDKQGIHIHRTPNINGTLKSITVMNKNPLSVLVISLKFPDLVILRDKNAFSFNQHYIKTQNIMEDTQPLNIEAGQFSEIVLNEQLEISLTQGKPNDMVKVVIRYA